MWWGLSITAICILTFLGALKLALLIYAVIQRVEEKRKEKFEQRDN